MLSNPEPRRRIVLTAAVMSLVSATLAFPQTPVSSFSDLKDLLIVGHTITVTDTAGRRTAGRLSEISEASLGVLVDGTPNSFSASDVRRVQERRGDSLVNGLLIGAASGAAYAIYWYVRDPNECHNTVCGSDLARGVAIGGAIGLAIDAAIKHNVTVYLRPDATSAGHPTLVPGSSRLPVRALVAVRW